MNTFKYLYVVFIFISISLRAIAGDAYVNIPLDDERLPSNDLVYQGNVLNPEQALELKEGSSDKLILSRLNPFENDLWGDKLNSELSEKLDSLAINNHETVQFLDTVNTNSTVLFFNVTKSSERDTKIFTVILEKNLHTALLRKNLLRKLGYKVPKMKYLKRLKVTFESIERRDHFIQNSIPQKTYGAASRWIRNIEKIKSEENTDLTLELQDLVVIEPSEKDHNNLAMGAPAKLLRSRTRRSLAIPYALLHLGESVNKFNWIVGVEENRNIRLPYFFEFTDLSTTKDDAIWILNRLKKLKREDFQEIVDLAYFPPAAAKLVLEKLISRRNYLLKLFAIKAEEIKFEQNINMDKVIVDSRLMQEEWNGYASRFAHGDAQSPLSDFQYYFYSKFETHTITNLISRLNENFEAFDIGSARLDYFQSEFDRGLTHFVETGEFLEFGVGTWTTPFLNGSLIMNRDIVIGNYMGTDNLVQLADTFGFSVGLGLHTGIEKVFAEWSGSVRTGMSLTKTFTHLKPVETLKQTVKEPLSKMIVPLLKFDLKKRMQELAEFAEESPEMEASLRKTALEELLTNINENLGVGESIVVTEKVSPNVLLTGRTSLLDTPFSLAPTLSAGVGADISVLRRIHLYRKDKNTIQVYDDHGDGKGLTFNFGINYYIPVLRIQARNVVGSFNLKVHDVNINPDIERNPNLHQNAMALYHLLKDNSFELLEDAQAPYEIDAVEFHDKSFKLNALIGNYKRLRGDTYYTVKSPNGKTGRYLHVSDKSQRGVGFEAFLKDTLNYYFKEYWGDYNISVDVPRWKNPAHTLWGHSWSTEYSFETSLKKPQENQSIKSLSFSTPFIRITERDQGWKKSSKRIRKKAKKINKTYGLNLFPEQILTDTKGLKLYDVAVNINLYEGAVRNIQNMNKQNLSSLERLYRKKYSNSFQCEDYAEFSSHKDDHAISCGYFDQLYRQIDKCEKEKKNETNKDYAKCLLKLTKKAKKYLNFKDFVEIVGNNNIYLYATIDGFRRESEVLNDTIVSNSFGRRNGRYHHGPLRTLINFLGLQVGEFEGTWLREFL